MPLRNLCFEFFKLKFAFCFDVKILCFEFLSDGVLIIYFCWKNMHPCMENLDSYGCFVLLVRGSKTYRIHSYKIYRQCNLGQLEKSNKNSYSTKFIACFSSEK